jgi:IS4 transposase
MTTALLDGLMHHHGARVETGRGTNQTALSALTICDLYKSRWQVELLFKWIKQHLRIKKFYGASENAVKTQIWIAVSVYVLVAIVRQQNQSEWLDDQPSD